jgi:hypothetical protein
MTEEQNQRLCELTDALEADLNAGVLEVARAMRAEKAIVPSPYVSALNELATEYLSECCTGTRDRFYAILKGVEIIG